MLSSVLKEPVAHVFLCFGFLWLAGTTVNAEECQDAHRSCYYWYLLDYCNDPVYASAMFDSCKSTCGHCNTDSLTRKSSRRRVSSRADCKDQRSDCSSLKTYCKSHESYMKRNCALTCSYCTAVSSTCKDDNQHCPSWIVYCDKSSIYWPYMSKNCKKTCKICTDGSGGGGGGDGNGGGSGKKEFQCSFEQNFCDWNNQHLDDAVNWAIGTVAGGPSSGANGTSSYAYVDTRNSGYDARLVLPWELVLPLSRTYIGTMCLNFKFQTGNGSLKFIEVLYPTINNKSPSPQERGTFSGSGTWVDGKVQVNVDNKRQLVIEGTTGSSGRVVIDEISFVKGRC